MRYSLKKSLKKLLGYCFIFSLLVLIVFVCISILSLKSKANEHLSEYIEVDNTLPKAIFIGSSRVRASIDPTILKQQLPAYDSYNFGVSGLGVLYGCQIAEKIIPDIPSGSLVYVELSDFRVAPSHSFYYFSTHDDLHQILKKRYVLGIELDELEKIFFSLVNIWAPLKAHFYPANTFLSEIGFKKDKAVYTGTKNLFLNKSDMIRTETVLTSQQRGLLNILNDLIESGKKKNTKVVFIMPLNAKGAELLPIFHAIPETHKWIYSTGFLENISHNKYLKDEFHLNTFGAHLYTTELVEEIRRSNN